VRRLPELVAAALGLLILAVVILTVVLDPPLADRLSREDDIIEWLQTALFALAAALAVRAAWDTWRAGASPILEILVAALLTSLVIGEVDLDRIVVGRKIISTRFLVDARVWIGWRTLALVSLVAPPAALAIYAFRRRTELAAGIRRAVGESWGRVLLAGLVIFGLTEAFERPLGRIPGFPRYIIEEAFELIAAIFLSVALYAHARAIRRRARKRA
jgi:hypothetical protein